MPGPPPKPSERKRALGNPGKRPLRKSAQVVALPRLEPSPPDSLGEEGRVAWSHVMSHAGKWLSASDAPILLMLAEAYDRRAYMLRVLSDEGWSIVTDKGYPYRHPLVPALADLEKQMTAWMSLLGLTPTDRSKLGLAEVKAASTLEKLQAKRDK